MNLTHLIKEDEVIKLVQDLVKIPSDWSQRDQEKKVLDYICAYLDKYNISYQTQKVDSYRYNIVVTYKGRGNGKKLLLNGHVDTVPPYEMDFLPYEAFIKDGYLHGRGSVDMKGAVSAMLMTLRICHQQQIPLKGDLIFSAVIGEESNSAGTEKLIIEGVNADGAIVGEPSNFDYAIGHRGLEWLEIEIIGKIAHSGVPENGINAIAKAAKLIIELESKLVPKLKDRYNEFTGPSILNYGTIVGGTQPSSVADKCIIQLDRRYVPSETPDQVIGEIQEIIDDLKLQDPEFQATIRQMDENIMNHLYHVPMLTNPGEEIVKTLVSTLRETLNKEPILSTRRGWTDGGLLSYYGKIPTVICGPGDISYSHSKNERIPVQQLVDAVDVYLKVACAFCGLENEEKFLWN